MLQLILSYGISLLGISAIFWDLYPFGSISLRLLGTKQLTINAEFYKLNSFINENYIDTSLTSVGDMKNKLQAS